jgi:hypothetical protein
MANTYSWNCRTVDCYPTFEEETDVVYNAHWRLTATSEEVDTDGNPYVASIYGTQVISTDDIGNPYVASIYGTQVISTDDITDFIPFADLTNATITEWVETTMGEEKVTEMKTNLDNKIESLINPTSVTLQVAE